MACYRVEFAVIVNATEDKIPEVLAVDRIYKAVKERDLINYHTSTAKLTDEEQEGF